MLLGRQKRFALGFAVLEMAENSAMEVLSLKQQPTNLEVPAA